MPMKQQDVPPKDPEQQERRQLNAKIGERVMHSLGQPSGLYSLQVRRLWKDHYRVNVLVGADAISAKMAHSYFLISDAEGNIIASTPSLRLPAPDFSLGGRKDPTCANP